MRYKLICALLAATLLLAGCAGDQQGGEESSLPEEVVIIEVEEEDLLEPEELEEALLQPLEMTAEEARALLEADETGVIPIYNREQLVALSTLVAEGDEAYSGASYLVQNEIGLSGFAFLPIGGGRFADEMPQFTGTFDGGNFLLFDLTITTEGANAVGTGLFGAVGAGGTIRNLHLSRGDVVGNNATGGVAGYCAGTLENCSFGGDVYSTGEGVGGLCGLLASGGRIEGCFSNTELSGNTRAGGFVGNTQPDSTLRDCYSLGVVHAIDSPLTDSPSQIGGFIGRQDGAVVENCYSYAEVYTRVAARVVGGFIGYNNGSPARCYYNATATENWEAVDANLDDTEFDITGCTVEQLLDQSTYAGWDFAATWGMLEGRNRGLPYLRAAWDD